MERASDNACFWGGTPLRQHCIPISSIHRLSVSFLRRIRKISMLGDRPVDKRLLGGIFLLMGCTVHVVDPHANKSEGMWIGNTLPYSAYMHADIAHVACTLHTYAQILVDRWDLAKSLCQHA